MKETQMKTFATVKDEMYRLLLCGYEDNSRPKAFPLLTVRIDGCAERW